MAVSEWLDTLPVLHKAPARCAPLAAMPCRTTPGVVSECTPTAFINDRKPHNAAATPKVKAHSSLRDNQLLEVGAAVASAPLLSSSRSLRRIVLSHAFGFTSVRLCARKNTNAHACPQRFHAQRPLP